MLTVNQLTGFGVGGGGKRFWRIIAEGDYLDAGSVTLYASAGETGRGLFQGGVATAESEFSELGEVWSADLWTDTDANTQWWPTNSTHWWQYELPDGINPVEIVLSSTINITGVTRMGFSIYWSEDGVTFTLQKTFATATYTNVAPEPILGATKSWVRLSLL